MFHKKVGTLSTMALLMVLAVRDVKCFVYFVDCEKRGKKRGRAKATLFEKTLVGIGVVVGLETGLAAEGYRLSAWLL